jgi:integrase/recombinase XerC
MRRKEPVTKYNGTTIRHRHNGTFAVDFWHEGKRKRKVFETLPEAKTQADQWKIEAKNKGLSAFTMADRDRADVAEFRKGERIVPLSDVFTFWGTHHPAGEHVTIEALVESFLSAPGRRGGRIVERRPATTEGHRKRLRAFVATFGRHPAHEVTQDDIETFLDAHGWSGLNRRHYLAAVRALFAFAVRKNHVGMNPAAGVELPEAATGEPVIMAVGDVEKYLSAIAATVPDLLPREALAFFCGLRPEELSRLDWRNVSMTNKLVTVTGDVAKVQGHRRNVTMPDNLLAWLAPFVRDAGAVWPFASPNTLRYKRAEARETAGVDVPDNAGRHAFASYHLAADLNAPATAEAMGHADVKLLRNVYRNIVASDGKAITQADGLAFFQVVPKGESNVIRFRAQA